MKIVIDIPEYIIENVKETKCLSIFYTETLAKAIVNGTPLPKGHGRLIDGDELKTLCYEVLVEDDNPNRADGLSSYNGLVEDDIDEASTIIEGETE